MDTKSKAWLKSESKKWVDEEIISADQCEQILLRYSNIKENNPLLVLFSIIGSLLIGVGIILVFATNWWSLPIVARVILAFIPLIFAQCICVYTLKNKMNSASFREGSAVFLCLTFFATLALVSQIFHISGDITSYLLSCVIFSIPAAYLMNSRGAFSIYVIVSLFVIESYPPWVALVLLLVSLPFMYLEITKSVNSKGINFLLLLLSFMSIGTFIVSDFAVKMSMSEIAFNCVLLLIVIDIAFRKINSTYFLTSAKLLAILLTSITLVFLQLDIFFSAAVNKEGIILAVIFATTYALLRYPMARILTADDILLCTAVLLITTAKFSGIIACFTMLVLGVFYIVQGSKNLVLSYINFGMTLVMIVIITRFFDSAMGLLQRGIVSILLGIVFLGVNLHISRKRKELSK